MNIRFIRLAGFLVPFLSFSWPKRQRLKKLAATDPKESFRLASQDVGNACRKMLDICGTELEVDGIENIPDEPVLFVGNHISYYDIVVTLANLPRGSGFVAKDSLAKIPGFKGWMDLSHCLYLDRKDLKKGVQMIKDGIEIINFSSEKSFGKIADYFPEFKFTLAEVSLKKNLIGFKRKLSRCDIIFDATYGDGFSDIYFTKSVYKNILVMVFYLKGII